MTWRKALREKLAARSGDTLVEALTAILIAALGSALLATMVVSATNVASKNESALSAVYQAESNLATVVPSSSVVSVSIPAQNGLAACPPNTIYVAEYKTIGTNGVEFVRYVKAKK